MSAPVVGVQGQPVKAISRDQEVPGPAALHEAKIARLRIALAKERRGRKREDRITELENALYRHAALLTAATGG
ncbi:MAG: hypothetical protein GKS00_21990 [Alphaproteobacteria bacterium]|nr:hypothetical protein [Alphaproteobacteria bacterium]